MQGRVLNNRYELLNSLGQGGMATVYRGLDRRLGRPVAIKVLHAQYATDDEFRQRFEHEAQSAAGLSAHPNIVDVYDVGQDEHTPFIIMELVEGSDLKAIIEQEGPLSVERVLNISQQVADGLEYAHTRGLIHRDIKPQNIMVAADGSARITDFGIAKSHLSTAVTQAGMTYGTADYISPEQAQGLPATPQSDVYSLGVVVYEMLGKHLPFTGDSPMAVALQHIQQPPPPLRQWNPQVPPSLERIVLGALAKDPRQRPASARAFASSLREYRTARGQETMAVPVAPRPTPPAQPQATIPVQRVQAPPPVQRGRGTTEPMAAVPPPIQPPRARRPAPAVAPPPLAYPERRGGSGIGGWLLGLMLLVGLLGIAYLAFATDTLDRFLTAAPAPTAVVDPAVTEAPAPTSPPAPTNTPTVLVLVPNVLGQTEEQAVRLIEAAGLTRGVLEEPEFYAAPRTTVIRQSPPGNERVPQGSEVKIQISLGPEQTAVPTRPAVPTRAVAALPNLVGQQADAAIAALEGAGFRVQRQNQPSREVTPGAIISQNPAPGEVEPGTTVSIVVSQGDVVEFPAVVGTQRADAEAAITATEGLTLAQVDEQGPDRLPNYESIPANQVVSATANGQPVDNGQLVPRGSRIVIGVRRP